MSRPAASWPKRSRPTRYRPTACNSATATPACAAALAGSGQGVDAGQLDGIELIDWRKQALQWLRADLEAYSKLLALGDPNERRRAQERLRSWRSEPALAGLRDATAVALLPADEQESCKRLWAEVQAMLAKAGAAD